MNYTGASKFSFEALDYTPIALLLAIIIAAFMA